MRRVAVAPRRLHAAAVARTRPADVRLEAVAPTGVPVLVADGDEGGGDDRDHYDDADDDSRGRESDRSSAQFSCQQRVRHRRTARHSCVHANVYETVELEYGPSVNKEYLSQIQLYSIFGELPVLSSTVLIITVCMKVANSTFLVTNKRTKWAELSRYYLCNCFIR